MRGHSAIPVQLTKQMQMVQFPSDGEKTSPSALATPSCRHPASHGCQGHPPGNSRGAILGTGGIRGSGLTRAGGAATPSRSGKRVGAGNGAAHGVTEDSSPLPGHVVAHPRSGWCHGKEWEDGMLTWQVQLWQPGSVQRLPGSREIPRCQQRWDGGMEVPGAPMARGDGSGDRGGEEGGNWVPGAATGRRGEGEPLGSRWEPGGSKTRVGGCCRDCRMGDGARIDLGYPRKEIRKAETSFGQAERWEHPTLFLQPGEGHRYLRRTLCPR